MRGSCFAASEVPIHLVGSSHPDLTFGHFWTSSPCDPANQKSWLPMPYTAVCPILLIETAPLGPAWSISSG